MSKLGRTCLKRALLLAPRQPIKCHHVSNRACSTCSCRSLTADACGEKEEVRGVDDETCEHVLVCVHGVMDGEWMDRMMGGG